MAVREAMKPLVACIGDIHCAATADDDDDEDRGFAARA
jgi:hypothetical protein